MTPTTAAHSALTREQIEQTIASLQPVHRIMMRLLLLPFMDPSAEDIDFMARERTEPNMRAGGNISIAFGGNSAIQREKINGVPKDWLVAVEFRAKQYQGNLREHQHRLNLHAEFAADYLTGLGPEIEVFEKLLSSECALDRDALDDLKAQAKLSPLTYALKKLATRAEKSEIEEEEYVRERLSLEYQSHLRRRARFKKRLEQIKLERQSSLTSSLSDEFLAEIWGVSVQPITARRVKAVQHYINALASMLKAGLDKDAMTAAVNAGIGPKLPGGSKNDGIGTKPVEMARDLWSLTVQTLAEEPLPPMTPKPCTHAEGGTKGLAAKLRGIALYEIGEDEEIKIWTRTTQCLNCLTALRAAQMETGIAARQPDDVLEQVKARTAFPRKEELAKAEAQAKSAQEENSLDLEERLRPFIGDDAGQVGAARWW